MTPAPAGPPDPSSPGPSPAPGGALPLRRAPPVPQCCPDGDPALPSLPAPAGSRRNLSALRVAAEGGGGQSTEEAAEAGAAGRCAGGRRGVADHLRAATAPDGPRQASAEGPHV